jgi:hypothetical protein
MQSNRLEIAARYESNVVFDQIVMTFHKRPLIILNLDITSTLRHWFGMRFHLDMYKLTIFPSSEWLTQSIQSNNIYTQANNKPTWLHLSPKARYIVHAP